MSDKILFVDDEQNLLSGGFSFTFAKKVAPSMIGMRISETITEKASPCSIKARPSSPPSAVVIS